MSGTTSVDHDAAKRVRHYRKEKLEKENLKLHWGLRIVPKTLPTLPKKAEDKKDTKQTTN